MKLNKGSYQKLIRSSLAMSLMTGAIVSVAPLNSKASTKLFSDVKTSDYYYESVKELSHREVISGYSDGLFKPHLNVTRGQVAKMIALTLKLDTKNVKDPGFIDVKKEDPNYGVIAALANKGIINGYEDKTFKPNNYVTRAQIAKILVNGFGIEKQSGGDLPFSDVNTSQWYATYIDSLYSNSITTGKTVTTFEPDGFVTRGQISAFITRAEKTKAVEIISISSNQIELTNGTFEISNSLKDLINPTNAPVLKGALIKYKVNNGVLESIQSIDIQTNGINNTTGQLILDGNGSTFAGDVAIKADFIALKNWTIKGKLELSNNINNYFLGEDIHVSGQTIIGNELKGIVSASAINKNAEIIFKNSRISNVMINRNQFTSLISNGKSILESIHAHSNFEYKGEKGAILENLTLSGTVSAVTLYGSIKNLSLNTQQLLKLFGDINIQQLNVNTTPEVEFSLTGLIEKLSILNNKVQIQLRKQVNINQINLPAGTTVEEVIKNFVKEGNNPDSGTVTSPGPTNLEMAIFKVKELLKTLEKEVSGAVSVEVAQQLINNVKNAVVTVKVIDVNYDTSSWDSIIATQQTKVDLRVAVEIMDELLAILATDVSNAPTVPVAQQLIDNAKVAIKAVTDIDASYDTSAWDVIIATQQTKVDLRVAVEIVDELLATLATDVSNAPTVLVAQQLIDNAKVAIKAVTDIDASYDTSAWGAIIAAEQTKAELRSAVENVNRLLVALATDVSNAPTVIDAQQLIDDAKTAIEAVKAIEAGYNTTAWDAIIAAEQTKVDLKAAVENVNGLLATIATDVVSAPTAIEAQQLIDDAKTAIEGVKSIDAGYNTTAWDAIITVEQTKVDLRAAVENVNGLLVTLATDVSNAPTATEAQQFIDNAKAAIEAVTDNDVSYDTSLWDSIIATQQTIVDLREAVKIVDELLATLATDVSNALTVTEAQQFIDDAKAAVLAVITVDANYDTSEWDGIITFQQSKIVLREAVNHVTTLINTLGVAVDEASTVEQAQVLVNTAIEAIDKVKVIDASYDTSVWDTIIATEQNKIDLRKAVDKVNSILNQLETNVKGAQNKDEASGFVSVAIQTVNEFTTLYPIYDTSAWDLIISIQQQYIDNYWKNVIYSKEITTFDFQTIQPSAPKLNSKQVIDGDFTGNRKDFTIVIDEETIPVYINWKLSADFTKGQSMGAVVDSTIQDYYFKKYGAEGIMNRTVMAMGFGDTFSISSTKPGLTNKIELTGKDWSYFFDQQVSFGTDLDTSKNRTFTINDGTNNTTISLNGLFGDIDAMITNINRQLSRGTILASAVKIDNTHFKIISNDSSTIITIGGANKEDLFN